MRSCLLNLSTQLRLVKVHKRKEQKETTKNKKTLLTLLVVRRQVTVTF